MRERLSWTEIQQRYPDEWVLLDDPELDEGFEVRAGTLVHHSADKSETDDRAIELRLSSSALLFTGELDPDLAFAL